MPERIQGSLGRMTGRGRADPAGSPSVDQGEAPRLGTELLGFLKPAPGRWTKTVRVTGTILVVLAISETFRIPNPAISAYMVIIFFAADENATRKLAGMGGVLITTSLVVAVVQFMIDLSQPALRLALMALSTFTLAYLSRRLKLGAITVLSGLFIVSAQKNGDDILQGSMSAGYVPNTTSGSIPELAFMSPEEALLHSVLWELLAFVYPLVLILIVNRLAARPPSETLRAALVDRLQACAAFCRGEPDGEHRLVEAARSGLPAVLAQDKLAATFERGRYDPSAGRRLIDGVTRLLVVLVAWRRLPSPGSETRVLREAAEACEALALRLRTKGAEGRDSQAVSALGTAAVAVRGTARPLAVQLEAALKAIRGVLDGEADARPPDAEPDKDRSAAAGGARDPGPARFGLKLTLAVASAYLFMDFTDWSQIATCLTTCFVLATDSLGQTFHKLMLRISGALVGGAVGFATILLVMPMLTDIGDLFLVLTPVLLAFVWIRVGSERIAYFGQQAAFAFLLTVVQDFGPTLEFQAARNRIIGILVGEVAMFLVFSRLWPETVGDTVRAALADALSALADMLGGKAVGAEAGAYRRFDTAIAKVRSVLPDDPYETIVRRPGARRTIDAQTLSRVQALVVPVSVLANLERTASGSQAQSGRAEAMAEWLDRCAAWIRTGGSVEILVDTLPHAPTLSGAAGPTGVSTVSATRTYWLDVLERDLRNLLDDISAAASQGSRPHAVPQAALEAAER